MTQLEWTLWKRQVYFSSRTALAKSPGTTDCIFDIPHGVFPAVEDPARLIMKIRKFSVPYIWGTFNKNGVPGNQFVVREYVSGSLINTQTIDIFDGLPTEIPYVYLNGIALADRLNIVLGARLVNDYSVSYDINSAYMRYATTTPNATFQLDFASPTNPCANAMGFNRLAITPEASEIFSTQPILSSGFRAINVRFPQLSGGNWADNDEQDFLHPSSVFARIPLDEEAIRLNYIAEKFDTQFIIGNSEILDGNELKIQLTTERPGEFVQLPDGVFWNIELEFSAQIPAFLQLLSIGRPIAPAVLEDQDKAPEKNKRKQR